MELPPADLVDLIMGDAARVHDVGAGALACNEKKPPMWLHAETMLCFRESGKARYPNQSTFAMLTAVAHQLMQLLPQKAQPLDGLGHPQRSRRQPRFQQVQLFALLRPAQ